MREAFVVAQVEVRFSAVVGDEDFPVLERAHGTRIHVQIGIEFLTGYFQSAAFQKTTNGGRGNAFTERRYHPASHEYVFGHYSFTPSSDAASTSRETLSKSSGVSTPNDSYSVSTTRIRNPFSMARNCSSRSACSSGPTGSEE